jgi:hypothetical protein
MCIHQSMVTELPAKNTRFLTVVAAILLRGLDKLAVIQVLEEAL